LIPVMRNLSNRWEEEFPIIHAEFCDFLVSGSLCLSLKAKWQNSGKKFRKQI